MDDRLSALEKTVQNFKLVTNRIDVQAGFPEIKPKASIEERISHLEQIHDNFRIQGGLNVTVEGSLRKGFAICSTCPEAEAASGPSGGVGPPVVTGACCVDGDCSIQTPAGCAGLGGDYQGDGTDCDPNPCPETPTGACCVGEACTIETEDDCAGMAGTYQGDDTICDPNPCELPPCICGGFLNPDDGLYYNTKNYNNSVDNSACPPDQYCVPAYPEGCPDPGCHSIYEGCFDVFTVRTKHVTVPLTDTYSIDCDVTTTTEVVEVLATCSHAVNEEGTGCDLSCGDPVGGSNACLTLDPDINPEFFTECGVINTTITYSDPCIPV